MSFKSVLIHVLFSNLMLISSTKITPTQRIINGHIDTQNQFPWQAHIQASYANSPTINNCGGSIISNTYVLTAADCVLNAKTLKINLGSTYLSTPAKTLYSTVFFIHSHYNPNYFQNNIALIRLPETLKFTPTMTAIRLPSRSQVNETFVNHEAYFTGFGLTSSKNQTMSNRLQWVKEKVISNAECNKSYNQQWIKQEIICASGWDSPWQGPCNGDGGGPLFVHEFGTWTQIGVFSFFHETGCENGYPSGFARITSYFDWIAKTAGYSFRPYVFNYIDRRDDKTLCHLVPNITRYYCLMNCDSPAARCAIHKTVISRFRYKMTMYYNSVNMKNMKTE